MNYLEEQLRTALGNLNRSPVNTKEAELALKSVQKEAAIASRVQVPVTEGFLKDPDSPMLDGNETRLTGSSGVYPDAPEREGEGAKRYTGHSESAEDQEKARRTRLQHGYNFERVFGRQPTDEDLHFLEKAQRKDAYDFFGDGEATLEKTGKQSYGREVVRAYNDQGQDLADYQAGFGKNMAYSSAWNYKQRQKDIGKWMQSEIGNYNRTLPQASLDAVQKIAQTAGTSTLTTLSEALDVTGLSTPEFSEWRREKIHSFDEWMEGLQGLPLRVRKQKYEQWQQVRAGMAEDTIKDIMEKRGVDKGTAEALYEVREAYETAKLVLTDPALAIDKTAEVAGFLVPNIIGGGIAGKVGTKTLLKLRNGEKLTKADQITLDKIRGATGITIGAVQEGASASMDFREKILSTDFDTLEEASEVYRNNLKKYDGDKEKARLATADSEARNSFLVNAIGIGLSSAALSKFGLSMEAIAGRGMKLPVSKRALSGSLGDTTRRVAGGLTRSVGANVIEEAGVQEPFNQLVENYFTKRNIDPDLRMTQGLGRAAGEAVIPAAGSAAVLTGVPQAASEAGRATRGRPQTEMAATLEQGIDSATQQHGLPPIANQYLKAIVDIESGWGQNNVGKVIGSEISGDMAHAGDKAMGPFQFMTSTAKGYGLVDRMDPIASADAAARLLQDNYNTIKAKNPNLSEEELWHKAALAHHSGAGAAASGKLGKWGKDYDKKLRQRVGAYSGKTILGKAKTKVAERKARKEEETTPEYVAPPPPPEGRKREKLPNTPEERKKAFEEAKVRLKSVVEAPGYSPKTQIDNIMQSKQFTNSTLADYDVHVANYANEIINMSDGDVKETAIKELKSKYLPYYNTLYDIGKAGSETKASKLSSTDTAATYTDPDDNQKYEGKTVTLEGGKESPLGVFDLKDGTYGVINQQTNELLGDPAPTPEQALQVASEYLGQNPLPETAPKPAVQPTPKPSPKPKEKPQPAAQGQRQGSSPQGPSTTPTGQPKAIADTIGEVLLNTPKAHKDHTLFFKNGDTAQLEAVKGWGQLVIQNPQGEGYVDADLNAIDSIVDDEGNVVYRGKKNVKDVLREKHEANTTPESRKRESDLARDLLKKFGLSGNRIKIVDSEYLNNTDEKDIPDSVKEWAESSANGHSLSQPIGNGQFEQYIYVANSNESTRLHTLLHEVAHAIEHEYFFNAPEDTQRAIFDSFYDYRKEVLDKQDTLTYDDVRELMGGPLALRDFDGELDPTDRYKDVDKDHKEWLLDFDEWKAEQIAYWLKTDEKPRSVIGKFFDGLATLLQELYNHFTGQPGYKAPKGQETINAWLQSLYGLNEEPTGDVTGRESRSKSELTPAERYAEESIAKMPQRTTEALHKLHAKLKGKADEYTKITESSVGFEFTDKKSKVGPAILKELNAAEAELAKRNEKFDSYEDVVALRRINQAIRKSNRDLELSKEGQLKNFKKREEKYAEDVKRFERDIEWEDKELESIKNGTYTVPSWTTIEERTEHHKNRKASKQRQLEKLRNDPPVFKDTIGDWPKLTFFKTIEDWKAAGSPIWADRGEFRYAKNVTKPITEPVTYNLKGYWNGSNFTAWVQTADDKIIDTSSNFKAALDKTLTALKENASKNRWSVWQEGEAEPSDTPEFDKMPAYQPGQKSMTYAGVGARQAPPEILKKMEQLGKYLGARGYTLQSGHAEGSDQAFERGADSNNSPKNIFKQEHATDQTRTIAQELHPKPEALGSRGLNLMARNTNQVFGKDLNQPVDFVIAWTPDGLVDSQRRTRRSGGTGQAIDMAARKGIPVVNLANPDWEQKLMDLLGVTRETAGNPPNLTEWTVTNKYSKRDEPAQEYYSTLKQALADIQSIKEECL